MLLAINPTIHCKQPHNYINSFATFVSLYWHTLSRISTQRQKKNLLQCLELMHHSAFHIILSTLLSFDLCSTNFYLLRRCIFYTDCNRAMWTILYTYDLFITALWTFFYLYYFYNDHYLGFYRLLHITEKSVSEIIIILPVISDSTP